LIRRDFHATKKPQQQFPLQLLKIILLFVFPLLFFLVPFVFVLFVFQILQQFRLRTAQSLIVLSQLRCAVVRCRNPVFREREVYGKDIPVCKRRQCRRTDHPKEESQPACRMEADGARREKTGDALLPPPQLYLLSGKLDRREYRENLSERVL
jgi:hypothetical protein